MQEADTTPAESADRDPALRAVGPMPSSRGSAAGAAVSVGDGVSRSLPLKWGTACTSAGEEEGPSGLPESALAAAH